MMRVLSAARWRCRANVRTVPYFTNMQTTASDPVACAVSVLRDNFRTGHYDAV